MRRVRLERLLLLCDGEGEVINRGEAVFRLCWCFVWE